MEHPWLEKDIAPKTFVNRRWSAKSSLEQNAHGVILTEYLNFFSCNIPQEKMDGKIIGNSLLIHLYD